LIEYTVSALANETGRDRRSIQRRLLRAGVQPIRTSGRERYYLLRDVGPALWGSADGHDLDGERMRYYRGKADLDEITKRQRLGELIERTMVANFLFAATRTARDRLLSFCDRLAPILAAESNEYVVYDTLSYEARQTVTELASAFNTGLPPPNGGSYDSAA
jgi:hypothetical protein